jgi:Mce-associated membrane protein
VSGGGRQSAADTETVPVNEDETPTTAADLLALAEQAEAEAAEAEALAAAARARARVIQLRRKAELAEHAAAAAEETAQAPASPVTELEATEVDEADAAETVQSEKQEPASQDEAGKAEETEELPVDGALETEEEPDVDVSADEAETEEKPSRLGRVRRLRRRPRWSTVAAGVAIIVILASLGGSVYLVLQHREANQRQRRAAEFAAAARQGVVTLTSVDYNDAKQSVQRVIDDATGTFKDEYLKTADDFTKVVEQSKVVAHGTVQAAAVDMGTMTDDSADVLVTSTSDITNAAGAKQDPRNYRLVVTITRDGGQLKMSKVEFAP